MLRHTLGDETYSFHRSIAIEQRNDFKEIPSYLMQSESQIETLMRKLME